MPAFKEGFNPVPEPQRRTKERLAQIPEGQVLRSSPSQAPILVYTPPLSESIAQRRPGRKPLPEAERKLNRAAAKRRYKQSEKGREKREQPDRRYEQSTKGKDRHSRYVQTEKGREKARQAQTRFQEKRKQHANQKSYDIFP